MAKPQSFFRIFTESGPLIVLAAAVALVIGCAAPASAQWFNFGFGGQPSRPPPSGNGGYYGGGGGGWFGRGGNIFAPFQQSAPRQEQRIIREDYSHAPPPEKRDTTPERNILVLGDAMADWLAYGLEDAYADQPDVGISRRHKTVSGLLKYQPKGDPADWAAAARQILATEKPDVIVVMLGLSDRVPIHEPAAADDKKKKDAHGKPNESNDATAKPDDKDSDLPPEDADNSDAPPTIGPQKSTRSPNGIYEFREERWAELYDKKIDEMIGVLKSKGVPVVWVGLPAIRGTKATSDMLFLDSLYRDAAGKAGITYVDVWDGFVDESGRYLQQGPDFEGQTRRLRSYDGVFFTQAGARKLAHYVEREVSRLLAARSAPIALPTEPGTPDANAQPGQPAPRPLAGPIVPLVASSINSDQLLGGPGSRPAPADPLTLRTLVKGEPLAPPAGRADDFAWPHREIGHEPAKEPSKGEAPVASATPNAPAPAAVATPAPPATAQTPPPKPKKPRQPGQATADPEQQQLQSRPLFFGNGPRQAPSPDSPPRPPADVGSVAPGYFTR
jgi:uncharacterized protein